MNKKKLALAGIVGITALTFGAVVLGTVSWFQTTIAIPKVKIDGNSAGAYFAYGNGNPRTGDPNSSDKPYGISHPRHLYNLAWLQYNGFFAGGQYYFELSPELITDGVLDMSGWKLPPIGTTANPFVGNFNGNGIVITNLTVTNDQTTLFAANNKHPDPSSITYTAPEIVGMFGVVGNYNNAITPANYVSATNTIKDLGISNFTIQTTSSRALVGIAAGYVDATVSNVAVNNSTVNIGTANTSNVSNSLTTNLSDYGVVGYVTDNHKKSIKTVEEQLYDINISTGHQFNALDEGDDEGWGGSINMKTIYYRIVALRKNKSTNVEGTFNWLENRKYYDDVLEPSETTGTKTLESETDRTPHYQRVQGSTISGHEYIGNYNVYIRNATYTGSGATTDQSYLYLSGGHWENRTYYTKYAHTGYYISNGTNYLSINTSGALVHNVTSPTSLSVWNFSSTSGTATISASYNGTTYYLYNDNGTLTTSTSSSTTWTITTNGGTMQLSNNGLKISYYNSKWQLVLNTNDSYYVIKDRSNTNYMSSASSGSTPGTVSTPTYRYYLDESNRVYYLNGNTKLYLAIYYTYSSTLGIVHDTVEEVRLINGLNVSNYNYVTYTSSTFRTTVNVASSNFLGNPTLTPTTTYVTYSSGWTYTTTSSNSAQLVTINGSSLTITNALSGDPQTIKGPDFHQTSSDVTKGTTNSKTYYTAEDTTYFPLNVEKDIDTYITTTNATDTRINRGDLDPKDSNTGYIIAGSSFTNALTGNRTYNSSQASNIRISEYQISDINASIDTDDTTLEDFDDATIWTINDTNAAHPTMSSVYSEDTYPRYKASKESFYKNSLTNAYDEETELYTVSNNVYGLHFMDSTINTGSLVNGAKVSVLGNKCDSYQFPVDCVDFNLKQKGVVNFFAGTYFTGNNSFFSLHEVFRNSDAVQKTDLSGDPIENQYTSYNTISNIKEIAEIYSTDRGSVTSKYANIYRYKGATGTNEYSVPYRIDGNQNKFKMNKDSTTDTSVAYTYDTMDEDDFLEYCATYGYTSRFKTEQIGVQPSTLTTNRIYYFEFPMNPGEYCLGSVTGGTGAYLLYLDIGANALKTQRTIIYERYKEIKKVFDYPEGIAVIAVSTVQDNIDNSRAMDERNTANFLIRGNTSGSITVARNVNDVTLTRSGSLSSAAKPTLVGDLMWDDEHQQYNIHDPGGTNLSNEITSEDTNTEVRILKYLDYNVNLEELTVTSIIDTSTDGGLTFTRTYLQQYQNGTYSTDVNTIKVYHTVSGTRYTPEQIADQEVLATNNGTVSTTLIVSFEYFVDSGVSETHEWSLEYIVDQTIHTGRYYMFQDYVFEVTVTGGSITFKVLSVGSRTIKINGTTITSVGQEITVPTPAP